MFNKITYLLTYPAPQQPGKRGRSVCVAASKVTGERRLRQNTVVDGSGCRPPSVKSLDAHSGARSRAGSAVEGMDPLRFLAGCRKRRLNQALSVLSLSLEFLFMYVLCC